MPTDYESVRVKCPYYMSSSTEDKTITCEGVIRGTSLTLRFRRGEVKRRYMEMFCDSLERCPECRISHMLDGKYEEER